MVSHDPLLLDELLKHTNLEDVQWVFDNSPSLGSLSARACADRWTRVSQGHFRGGSELGFKRSDWTRGVSRLAAATYDPNRDAVRLILDDHRITECHGASLLADLLSYPFEAQLPAWLCNLAATDPQFIYVLCSCGSNSAPHITDFLSRLSGEIDTLRPAAILRLRGCLTTRSLRRTCTMSWWTWCCGVP